MGTVSVTPRTCSPVSDDREFDSEDWKYAQKKMVEKELGKKMPFLS